MRDMRKLVPLIALLVAFVSQSANIGVSLAQEETGSVTFHTIIFSGVVNGEPQVNITSKTINGTNSEIQAQLPQVVDWLLNITEGLSDGPTVFLGSNATDSYVVPAEPTREEHLSYLESALANATMTDRPKEECWHYFVGGGSMHGDCPPATVQ